MFFYTKDLPDLNKLADFAPKTPATVSDPCLETPSNAIPYDSIGQNTRRAIAAVEAAEDDPEVLSETLRAFAKTKFMHRPVLSLQVARTMFCRPSKELELQINELRAALQLERRFSRAQLLTMFANRVSFGEGLTGIQSASQHYFRKNPDQLDLEEAALLAGVITAPSYLSPVKHPDRQFGDATRSSMQWPTST